MNRQEVVRLLLPGTILAIILLYITPLITRFRWV